MPRPRVQPQDRLRSVRACDVCKASKKRCDSQLPCRACSERNEASNCTYSHPVRRRASQRVVAAPPVPSPPSRGRSRSRAFPTWSSRVTSSDGTGSSYVQQPVMVSSSSGEQGIAAPSGCRRPYFCCELTLDNVLKYSLVPPQLSRFFNSCRRLSSTMLDRLDLRTSNTAGDCSRLRHTTTTWTALIMT